MGLGSNLKDPLFLNNSRMAWKVFTQIIILLNNNEGVHTNSNCDPVKYPVTQQLILCLYKRSTPVSNTSFAVVRVGPSVGLAGWFREEGTSLSVRRECLGVSSQQLAGVSIRTTF